MAMPVNEIEAMIKAALPDAVVTIEDLAGDGDHYAASVVSEAFRGKSRVAQHQLVYAALPRPHGRRTPRPRPANLSPLNRSHFMSDDRRRTHPVRPSPPNDVSFST